MAGDLSERTYLHDLTFEQAERLRLIRAGQPIPPHLEPKKNPGNKSYPKLKDPPPLITDRKSDPRKVHFEDPKWETATECGLFWRSKDSEKSLLRHTTSWAEVTCRKCLTYK